jgi:hypothetical protein
LCSRSRWPRVLTFSDRITYLLTWLDRMFLKHIDLTTALRPSYLPDEVLLFVQDNVGLYEG